MINGTLKTMFLLSPLQDCEITSCMFIWCSGSTSLLICFLPQWPRWACLAFQAPSAAYFPAADRCPSPSNSIVLLNATYNNNVEGDEQLAGLLLALRPPHLSIAIPVRIWALWKPDASGSPPLLGVMASRGSSAGAASGLRCDEKGVKTGEEGGMKQCIIFAYGRFCLNVYIFFFLKKGGKKWRQWLKPTKLYPAVITVRIHSRAVHLFIFVNCEGRLSLCHLLINTQVRNPVALFCFFFYRVCETRQCSALSVSSGSPILFPPSSCTALGTFSTLERQTLQRKHA